MLLKAEKQYRIKDIMNCLPKFFLQFLLLVSCVFFLIFIWACLLELCFALVVGGVSLIFDGISVVLVHHRMLSSGEGACGDLLCRPDTRIRIPVHDTDTPIRHFSKNKDTGIRQYIYKIKINKSFRN